MGAGSEPQPNILNLEYKLKVDAANNSNEEALQRHLFILLRASTIIKYKKQVFYRVYKFASCVCADIRPAHKIHLARKWGKWTRKGNRDKLAPSDSSSPSADDAQLNLDELAEDKGFFDAELEETYDRAQYVLAQANYASP